MLELHWNRMFSRKLDELHNDAMTVVQYCEYILLNDVNLQMFCHAGNGRARVEEGITFD